MGLRRRHHSAGPIHQGRASSPGAPRHPARRRSWRVVPVVGAPPGGAGRSVAGGSAPSSFLPRRAGARRGAGLRPGRLRRDELHDPHHPAHPHRHGGPDLPGPVGTDHPGPAGRAADRVQTTIAQGPAQPGRPGCCRTRWCTWPLYGVSLFVLYFTSLYAYSLAPRRGPPPHPPACCWSSAACSCGRPSPSTRCPTGSTTASGSSTCCSPCPFHTILGMALESQTTPIAPGMIAHRPPHRGRPDVGRRRDHRPPRHPGGVRAVVARRRTGGQAQRPGQRGRSRRPQLAHWRATREAAARAASHDGLITLDDLLAARDRVKPVIRPTPVDRSDSLSRLAGRPVLLKPEHRQRTGSFKIRGAYNHIAQLPPGVARGGGVGRQPRPGGGPGRLADRADRDHLHAARGGAAQGGRHPGLRRRRSGSKAKWWTTASPWPRPSPPRPGAVYVPPFDDPQVIAGQGTIGLELVEEAPEAEVVVVPVGGGGLLSGVAAALTLGQRPVRVGPAAGWPAPAPHPGRRGRGRRGPHPEPRRWPPAGP